MFPRCMYVFLHAEQAEHMERFRINEVEAELWSTVDQKLDFLTQTLKMTIEYLVLFKICQVRLFGVVRRAAHFSIVGFFYVCPFPH